MRDVCELLNTVICVYVLRMYTIRYHTFHILFSKSSVKSSMIRYHAGYYEVTS